MVSAGDYWPFVEAIRRARRAWWLGATSRRAVEREVIWAAGRTRTLLADGPRPRRELLQALGVDGSTWNGIGLWVDLVRVPPSGTWDRRSADLYGLAEDWVGPPAATEQQGIELLIRRYLAGFGPASIKDLASWSGLPPASLGPALGRISLRRFRDPDGGELVDLPRRRSPTRRRPRRSASSRRGMRRCSCMHAGRRSCRSASGRGSSAPRPRTRHRPSSSTGRLPGPGGWKRTPSGSRRSNACHVGPSANSTRRPSVSPPSTARRVSTGSLPRRGRGRPGPGRDGTARRSARNLAVRRGSVTPTEVGGCYGGAAPSRPSSPTVRSSSPTIRLGKPRKASTNDS